MRRRDGIIFEAMVAQSRGWLSVVLRYKILRFGSGQITSRPAIQTTMEAYKLIFGTRTTTSGVHLYSKLSLAQSWRQLIYSTLTKISLVTVSDHGDTSINESCQDTPPSNWMAKWLEEIITLRVGTIIDYFKSGSRKLELSIIIIFYWSWSSQAGIIWYLPKLYISATNRLVCLDTAHCFFRSPQDGAILPRTR